MREGSKVNGCMEGGLRVKGMMGGIKVCTEEGIKGMKGEKDVVRKG